MYKHILIPTDGSEVAEKGVVAGVEYAREVGATAIVKGLRAISDFEYELQMADMNAALAPGLDTFFVTAKPAWAFLSSSLVKEVARFGGAVEGLVPEGVARALKEKSLWGKLGIELG